MGRGFNPHSAHWNERETMERRRFLKLGGLISATATTAGVAVFANEAKSTQEPLPEFREGSILTAEALNAMIVRINELESRIL